MAFRFGAVFGFTLALIAAGSAQAQAPATDTGPVRLTAGRDNVTIDMAKGYARMLFAFDRPTPVAASLADGVLSLRLNRAIDFSTDLLAEKLAPYVSAARRDEDGLTYRFALGHPMALHSSVQGNLAAIDLVPDGFSGVPPDLPAPPQVQRKELPDVTKLPVIKVRIGEFSNLTRLTFDWPAQVLYTIYAGKGRVSVRFETMARPDFSMLDERAPPWVKSAGWHLDAATTVVEFETDPEAGFHDFRDGNKIAIDVMAPKTDAAAVTRIAPGTYPAPAPVIPSAAPPRKGTDAAANAAAKPPARPVPPPSGPQVITATAGPSAELIRDGAALHFPGARGKSVALFTRGDALWIVLDGHPPLDAATLLTPLAALIERASSEQVFGAEVLRLAFKSPLLASLSESDAALDITLSATAATPPDAIAFTHQGADGQTILTARLPGATHAILLNDVDAGDRLFVVPAKPGKGVLTDKRFVELHAFPTSAGLAVLPKSDDLDVQVRNETAIFSRPRGLALSAASGAVAAPVVQFDVSNQGPGFIDFAQWGQSTHGDVYGTERTLRRAVARVAESESNKARLTLARFLLAHGLASEALGEIQLMQAADPKLAGDAGLTAIKGAAQYMMGRYSDARLSLSAGALASDPHAAMWRGMAEAELQDFANARRDLLAAQSVLHLYPDAWQTRARLARAETGLAQGDLASANDALDQLSPSLSPRDSVEARLYAARLLAAQAHTNEAIARLKALERTDYPPIAAKATYARVEAEIAAKKIKPADAIAALEQLRYRWRGDDLELNTLRKLGSLYFADRRWREGLDVLQVAAVNFPGSDLGRQAQDDMRRAFNDLFLGGKADSMRPVDALALFYDYIALTPVGRDGDEMIRRLSDHLVAIDLLAPAEQLLEHQVKERLEGVARAQVATKLATIYLLDRKPKEALATIAGTRQTRLPDDLGQQRRLLEARALAGLKQYDAAGDLVADDDTPEARRLRADIAWDSGNWKAAGARAEELLGQRWSDGGVLSNEERAQVLRAGVAYSLGGDQANLAKLREHYADKMNATPDAKAFGVVTDKIDQQGVAFRDLAKQIASVDTLTAFMADFKKRETETQTAKN